MQISPPESPKLSGFTLIELSIVLVIIGLLIGGILVGRDLISAATIRSQISQIDKYNSAVNTFRLKYNALPGDMLPATATALGFFARTGGTGDGDGNGVIGGLTATPIGGAFYLLGGETVLFWTDLSKAGLIDASLNDSNDALVNGGTTDAQYAAELPHAKIGNGNYVWVNGYYYDANSNFVTGNGFQIIAVAGMGTPLFDLGEVQIYSGITPIEAYNIDKKIDDGLPLSGKVLAMMPDSTFPTTDPGFSVNTTTSTLCVTGAVPYTYNTGTKGVSTSYNCSLRFQAQW